MQKLNVHIQWGGFVTKPSILHVALSTVLSISIVTNISNEFKSVFFKI